MAASLTKIRLKKVFYRSLSVLGIYQLGRFCHRHQALILTYHGILQASDDLYMNRNCIDAATFDRQMAFMARHYNVVSLSDLVRWLSTGQNLPPRTAVITFDDGFRNNFTVALPILKKYHLPATVFLVTSLVSSDEHGLWTERVDWLIHCGGKSRLRLALGGTEKVFPLATNADREVASDEIRAYLKTLPPAERNRVVAMLTEQIELETAKSGDPHAAAEDDAPSTARNAERYAFLTWEEVQTMEGEHITFGSHTHSHAILSRLTEGESLFELSESRRLIEENLGKGCALFSYPNGKAKDFGPREEEILTRLGYSAAVSQMEGFNDASTNRMALRRINIPRDESFSFFLAKISGVWALLKRLQLRGWAARAWKPRRYKKVAPAVMES